MLVPTDSAGAGRMSSGFDNSRPGDAPDMARPLLSITMPTRNRATLFERALASVGHVNASVAGHIEVAVSDGSDDDSTGQVVRRFLVDWPGRHRYVWNRPALAMVENMNRAMELATGEWIQQLHDDDYLLPGAGTVMRDAIRRAGPGERVLVFGAEIVDAAGVRLRSQTFRREQYLEPREALRRLLRNSSFARQPSVVVHRSAFERVGLFDPTVGGAADVDLWVRLFSRYGVRCVPHANSAYTIHEAAATTGMWHPGTIQDAHRIFGRAMALGLVPDRTI
ncbi:MAG TPA: glycosyltransferase, partial [Acidimicrobiales bacterium]|nr:glycosyltransferase [Acidimicrobiales bacterium]